MKIYTFSEYKGYDVVPPFTMFVKYHNSITFYNHREYHYNGFIHKATYLDYDDIDYVIAQLEECNKKITHNIDIPMCIDSIGRIIVSINDDIMLQVLKDANMIRFLRDTSIPKEYIPKLILNLKFIKRVFQYAT